MPVLRTFERDGKQLAISAHDRDGAIELLNLSRTRIRQGWNPVTPVKAAIPFVKALEKFGVQDATWVIGLTDEELDVVYADLIERAQVVSTAALMKRPTRALFAYMLKTNGSLLKGAVKFLSGGAESVWMVEELDAALEKKNGFDDDRGRTFAERWRKRLDGPAKVAPKHDATTDEAKLLAAILAAPDDDGPRQIYADWLLDQGNRFGEYIHAALAAHADQEAAETTPATELADRLEKKFGKAWLAPIKPFARSTRFHRGLVGRIETEGDGFVKAAAAIAARSPRAVLQLEGVKKKHIALIAKAPLGTFSRVELAEQRLEDADIVKIVGSPTLAGVTELDLSSNKFGAAGLLAIANSPYLASLEILGMGQPYAGIAAAIPPDVLAAVFQSKRLPRLRELSIAGDSFTGAFNKAVHQLTSLSIDAVSFANADAAELVGAKAFASLERLTIQSTRDGKGTFAVDQKTLTTIAKSLKKLTYFAVDNLVIKAP